MPDRPTLQAFGPDDPELFDPESLTTEKGDLAIGTSSGRVIAVIKPDGRVLLANDVTADEAAIEFWEAMGRRRLGAEDRILVIHHMEAALTRLGAADLHYETAHKRLVESQTSENLMAERRADAALQKAANQCIQLGRALTRGTGVAPMPKKIPDSVKDNPNNDYDGSI